MKVKKLHSKRKAVISAISLVGAVGVLVFGVLALLSDIIIDEGSFTAAANTETLDISGQYHVYLNGALQPTNHVTVQPDDVVVVKATITNYGSKSAWLNNYAEIKEQAVDSGIFVRTACGERTKQEMIDDWSNSSGYSYAECMGIGGGFDEQGRFLTGSNYALRVINGTGGGADVETVGNAQPGLLSDPGYPGSVLFVGSNSFTVAFTYYFHPTHATVGGEVVTFDVRTMAAQYRGNNSAIPDYTTWETVVSTPQGL
ncbi:MAG: hypothetical protein LBL84_02170 [Candidatus Nomurabacteria bacterium]|jgi:hypothetical protein|nr:hypothetical protein [Candidatus Nomurabacteria bacterium]